MMPDSAQELALYAAAWLTAAFVVACVVGHVLRRISDRFDVPRWLDDQVDDELWDELPGIEAES